MPLGRARGRRCRPHKCAAGDRGAPPTDSVSLQGSSCRQRQIGRAPRGFATRCPRMKRSTASLAARSRPSASILSTICPRLSAASVGTMRTSSAARDRTRGRGDRRRASPIRAPIAPGGRAGPRRSGSDGRFSMMTSGSWALPTASASACRAGSLRGSRGAGLRRGSRSSPSSTATAPAATASARAASPAVKPASNLWRYGSGRAGRSDEAIQPLFSFSRLCGLSWEQFSAIGQTFEDLVREWFLPSYVGQIGSGEDEALRKIDVEG